MVYYQHNKYLMVLQPYSVLSYAPDSISVQTAQVQLYYYWKSSFLHHLLQISNESSQVDFDVV